MTEAQFTTKFNRWLRHQWETSGAFELKVTATDSLPFDAVKDHQIAALDAASSDSGIVYKIPDDSIGFKPFDVFKLKWVQGWIVIRYHTDRRSQKEFVMIPVGLFVQESETSDRRSLTEERAKHLGKTCRLGI